MRRRELLRALLLLGLAAVALHLYGDKGVLALLEEDGYRAARVF